MREAQPARQLIGDGVLALVGNLRAQGLIVGVGDAMRAIEALEQVDLGDPEEFRLALRLSLCHGREDLRIFDLIYPAWLRALRAGGVAENEGRLPSRDDRQPSDLTEASAPRAGGAHGRPANRPPRRRTPPRRGAGQADAGSRRAEATDRTVQRRLLASGERGEGASAVRVPQSELRQMLDAAALLVARVRIGRSRSWRPMRRGRRLHFRRTLRQSLGLGGEMPVPRWLGHPRRNPRFVVFCDGSRSMADSSEKLLQFGYALMQRASRVEVFVFSTELRRVTHELRRKTGALPTLRDLGGEWGGGTRIGHSLRSFLHQYGARMLTRDTLVLIASDGLETGDVEELQQAMRQFRRRAAGVVWLNPLLGTPGYSPRARGMRVALPYIDVFADAHDVRALRRVARNLRLRR